jgi:uncharacterized membrane protein YeiH
VTHQTLLPGFNPTLLLVLNLIGTVVFGLSGGIAGVKAELDLFGVVVLVSPSASPAGRSVTS